MFIEKILQNKHIIVSSRQVEAYESDSKATTFDITTMTVRGFI